MQCMEYSKFDYLNLSFATLNLILLEVRKLSQCFMQIEYYYQITLQSRSTESTMWLANFVSGWAGVRGEEWKMSYPKNTCVGGYPSLEIKSNAPGTWSNIFQQLNIIVRKVSLSFNK